MRCRTSSPPNRNGETGIGENDVSSRAASRCVTWQRFLVTPWSPTRPITNVKPSWRERLQNTNLSDVSAKPWRAKGKHFTDWPSHRAMSSLLNLNESLWQLLQIPTIKPHRHHEHSRTNSQVRYRRYKRPLRTKRQNRQQAVSSIERTTYSLCTRQPAVAAGDRSVYNG